MNESQKHAKQNKLNTQENMLQVTIYMKFQKRSN